MECVGVLQKWLVGVLCEGFLLVNIRGGLVGWLVSCVKVYS